MQISIVLAGLNLPVCAKKKLGTIHTCISRKISSWCWNSIAASQCDICVFYFWCLIVRNLAISGCLTLIFSHYLLNMGIALVLMVCELFYHVGGTLCWTIANCLVIMSIDPIPGSHGFFVWCSCRAFGVVLSFYRCLGYRVRKVTLSCFGIQARAQQCATGYPICNWKSYTGGFSNSCANESRMDAWEQSCHLYGGFQHAVFHLSKRMGNR